MKTKKKTKNRKIQKRMENLATSIFVTKIAAPGRDLRLRNTTQSVSATGLVLGVLSAMFMSFAPRHLEVKGTLREAGRCGQSSVARRRCAERSDILHPFRINEAGAGVVAGLLGKLVLQGEKAPRCVRVKGQIAPSVCDWVLTTSLY